MAKQAYIGIDLGGTAIKYGLLTAAGGILSKGKSPTPSGRQNILKGLAGIISTLKEQGSLERLEVAGAGVGSPGLIDPRRGRVIGRAPNLAGWEGAEIKKELEAAADLRVVVDNDANAMALAEHRLGAGKGRQSGLYITVGTGIGSGIILDGKLWRGSRYAGAEMGHMTIVMEGRACPCGKRGCLEVYANAGAMELYFGKPVPPGRGAKYIFERAERAEDQAAIRAIEMAAQHLAAGIGSVLELIDPQIVVIGGGIAAGRSYLPAVRSKLPDYSSHVSLTDLEVVPAQLGNEAGMIGAALLAAGND